MIRTGLVFDILGALLIVSIVPVMVAVSGIGR
jgi:sodium-dependent dicarboxylate transporter 2/3/5